MVDLECVGMPVAFQFANHVNIIGFNIDKVKIEAYKNNVDPMQKVGDYAIKKSTIEWTMKQSLGEQSSS